MEELLNIAFNPVNAILSILLILLSLYWLLTILTGLDLDFFDIDFDVDADLDMDVDVDADVDSKFDVDIPENDVSVEGSESIWIQFLRFFGFDELPFMFLISVIVFVMWFLSVNATHYLGISTNVIGFLMLIPIGIISLFVAKLTTKPLVKLYRMIDHKGEEEIDFLGRNCKVLSSVGHDKLGQVEVMVKGDPIKIYVKGHKGESIKANEQAMVIDESKDKKFYYITKLNAEI